LSVVAKPVAASRAVVLRAWPTGETSTVAALLSEDHGYVRVIAKGARGARSALRPLVQPGRLVDIEFGLQPERELQYLKGGQMLLDPLLALNSLERTAYLLSALEIVDRCRPSGVIETRLFELCRRFLEVLSSDEAGAEAPLFYAFELALLRLQGTAPVLDREGRPLAVGVLAAMRNLTGADASSTALSRRPSREIGILLHGFLIYHLPGYRLPASLDLLRAGRTADGGAPPEDLAP